MIDSAGEAAVYFRSIRMAFQSQIASAVLAVPLMPTVLMVPFHVE
jgi:hypothetical protein